MATQRPGSPQRLDYSNCITDQQGNVFCPVIEEPQPRPVILARAPVPAAAPAPAPAPAVVVVQEQYASDDGLVWPPAGMNSSNCGCVITTPEQQNAVALARPRSLTNLNTYGAYNIDNARVNAAPQMLSYGSSGFFVDPARTLIKPDPIISMIPRPAPLIPGLMPPIKAPIHASQIDSRYPQKSVNMRRALGFAMLMSCLCPPIGLVGLGTALRGRHYRYGDRKRARRYRKASYGFSLMGAILVVLGIVIIILTAVKYDMY